MRAARKLCDKSASNNDSILRSPDVRYIVFGWWVSRMVPEGSTRQFHNITRLFWVSTQQRRSAFFFRRLQINVPLDTPFRGLRKIPTTQIRGSFRRCAHFSPCPDPTLLVSRLIHPTPTKFAFCLALSASSSRRTRTGAARDDAFPIVCIPPARGEHRGRDIPRRRHFDTCSSLGGWG